MNIFIKFKRILCLILSFVLVIPVLGNPVFAAQASTLSTESLFMNYPQYLSNEKMNKGTGACESACYAVLNSYNNKGSSLLAAIVTSINGGLKLTIQDVLSRFGATNSYADENLRIATNTFLLNYLNLGTSLSDTSDRIEKATKNLQKSYKIIKNIQTESEITAIRDPLLEFSNALGLPLTSKKVEEFIKEANESLELRDICGEISDGIDDAFLISDVMVGLFQVYCFDLAVIQDLMAELEMCNIKSSDLYKGLEMIYKEKTNGPIWQSLQDYLIPEAISSLASSAEILLYGLTGASTAAIALTKIAAKGIANALYTDAKADGIIQATYAVSFADTLELCIHDYRTRFLTKSGTSADIASYEMLYRTWLSADDTALDLCYKICKKKDQKQLGTDCVNAQRGLRETYTYENYLQWCKEAVPQSTPSGAEATAPTTAPAGTPQKADQEPTLWLTSETLPDNLQQGSNFGIRGTVSTSCGTIISLRGSLLDRAGNEVQSGQYYPGTASVDLRYTINNDLIFGYLTAGQYTYCVTAAAQNGSKQVTQELIRHSFNVISSSTSEPMPTPEPSVTTPATTPAVTPATEPARVPVLSISGQNFPENQKLGQNFGIRGTVSTDCGTITELYGAIRNSSGDTVCSGWYAPYSTTVDLRTTINNDLVFGTLAVGTYRYYVQAKAINNDQETVTTLIDYSFTVGATSESPSAEPSLNAVGYNMTVNVGKGSTLRFCSTTSTADPYEIGSIPNGALVYVYGTTQQQYEGRTWAKISYNGADGWVNYKWLS